MIFRLIKAFTSFIIFLAITGQLKDFHAFLTKEFLKHPPELIPLVKLNRALMGEEEFKKSCPWLGKKCSFVLGKTWIYFNKKCLFEMKSREHFL